MLLSVLLLKSAFLFISQINLASANSIPLYDNDNLEFLHTERQANNMTNDLLPVQCGTLSTNALHFSVSNPEHPDPTYRKVICETVIEHARPDITKLIIKLNQLNLYRPSYEGQCMHDKFSIFTDLNQAVIPVLCGNRSGETIEIPFLADQKYLIISVMTSNLDHDRIWHIEVIQS